MGFQEHIYIVLDDKLLTSSHTKKWQSIYSFKRYSLEKTLQEFLPGCTWLPVHWVGCFCLQITEWFKQYGYFVILHNKIWHRVTSGLVPKISTSKTSLGLIFCPFCPSQWAWYLLLVPRWLPEFWHQNGHSHVQLLLEYSPFVLLFRIEERLLETSQPTSCHISLVRSGSHSLPKSVGSEVNGITLTT